MCNVVFHILREKPDYRSAEVDLLLLRFSESLDIYTHAGLSNMYNVIIIVVIKHC